MNYDPVKYKRFERDPVGCFEAEMTANGWANTKFDHELQEHLLSDETSEFIRLVHHLFNECSDWSKLNKLVKKYGTEIKSEDYSTIFAFNYEEDMMDYIVHINRTQLRIFPYRKTQHKNIGRFA
jgi:predicted AlkP superfamily phosphohydrolase/phosphomutase